MGIDEMAIRLVLIVVLAFAIGLEREIKHQPAGLRTHILIGLGSTLLMIISIMMPELYESPVGDPARIAAQVVSGIGFIGAGVIMKMGFSTKGLTTAANIWITAAVGLAVGAGMFLIAVLATSLILFNLTVITSIKKKYIKQARYCNIKIELKKHKLSLKKLVETIHSLPLEILAKDIKENENKITITLTTKLSTKISTYDVHKAIRDNCKTESLNISESLR